ncbi:MAG TPA: hypothetical protein DCS43_07965 [Verrucomicrobia bacterium]|nr:hypothetical protein [Verrucomicrobiota bacterium]
MTPSNAKSFTPPAGCASGVAVEGGAGALSFDAPTVICSMFATELLYAGTPACRPEEVDSLAEGVRLVIAMPDDSEGQRETTFCARLAQSAGIQYRTDKAMHAQICERFGIPWQGRDCDDDLPEIMSLAEMEQLLNEVQS